METVFKKNVPLAQYTTLKVGGNASQFVTVKDEASLAEAVASAKARNLKITVLGGGSNVLVPDTGIDGLVIHIALKGIEVVQEGAMVRLTAGAGELLDDVVAKSVVQGWWGLENLSHIPGTVGATPIQNVGAYGVESADVIESVRVFNTETLQFEILSNAQCAFRYRDSLFKTDAGKRYIVTAVTYTLSKEPRPQIAYRDLAQLFENRMPSQQEIREAVVKIRAGKFPDWHEVGTAGSFFKNPIVSASIYETVRKRYPGLPAFPAGEGMMKLSLGWILDKVLGLRGFTKGNVSLYEKQALVLIAGGAATTEEITKFANNIVQKVKDEIGIEVEWEVTKV